MSPRVAIWTSAFEANMEAISSEVALLRRNFPNSISWGLSHRHWALLSPTRGFCLHPKLHLLFRAATRLLEPLFEINHVFGSVGDWFYLEGRRCRPTVLTAAAVSAPVERSLLDRVDRFVAEHPAGRDDLHRLGIDDDRIRLVLPPVDLQRFRPTERPAEPFTVLFASSPEESLWLDARGLPAILETAALRPQMRFRLLWRPWGDSLSVIRQQIEQCGLRNVDLVVGRVTDMAAEYARAHVTIAPFTDPNRCKPMPNSLIESLASGRPVICSPLVGLAPLIGEHVAGIVCDSHGAALAEALDRTEADWETLSRSSRTLAERHFDQAVFVRSYQRIYAELVPGSGVRISDFAANDCSSSQVCAGEI